MSSQPTPNDVTRIRKTSRFRLPTVVPRVRTFGGVAMLLVPLTLLVGGFGLKGSTYERLEGATSGLGDGNVSSYADVDANGNPRALGLTFSAKALATLPAEHSDGHRCFDANADGTMDHMTECSMWHERAIPLPTTMASRADMPFKWILLNWNPHGHIPPGVYDSPHFDVHFYLEPIENVFAIARGGCGPEFVRCDQFAEAMKPLPSNYIHPDFVNVQAAAPAMGNHLIDLSGPEFHGQPFTRSWIYGTYGGRITFYEEMLTRAHLLSKPNACAPIKSAAAVSVTGYYPQSSCIRHDADADVYSVSLEDFVLRQAEPPAPMVAEKTGAK